VLPRRQQLQWRRHDATREQRRPAHLELTMPVGWARLGQVLTSSEWRCLRLRSYPCPRLWKRMRMRRGSWCMSWRDTWTGFPQNRDSES
jgi:hypothetical protein